MTNLNKLELTLILALYYIDKGKNIDVFAQRFNQYFHKDISAYTILFSVTKFKNIDPYNNVRIDSLEDDYTFLWNEYITNDKISDLKNLYRTFKKGAFIEKTNIEDQDIDFDIDGVKITEFVDSPRERPVEYSKEGFTYERSREVVANALFTANYNCEARCSTELFVRKNSRFTYTEAHHLIPLCYQDEFEYSLDVEANVISLCPNCHRHLHNGADIVELLRKLYDQRRNRLVSCGLNISFEELLLLYR